MKCVSYGVGSKYVKNVKAGKKSIATSVRFLLDFYIGLSFSQKTSGSLQPPHQTTTKSTWRPSVSSPRSSPLPSHELWTLPKNCPCSLRSVSVFSNTAHERLRSPPGLKKPLRSWCLFHKYTFSKTTPCCIITSIVRDRCERAIMCSAPAVTVLSEPKLHVCVCVWMKEAALLPHLSNGLIKTLAVITDCCCALNHLLFCHSKLLMWTHNDHKS